MSTATICSIYPWEQKAERPKYQRVYTLPAVAKGDPPFLLPVPDEVQIEYDLYILGHKQKRLTVPGKEEIAPDLLREWSENSPGMTMECGPGIWIMRDTVDETDEDGNITVRAATKAEKEAMFAEDLQRAKDRQAAWFEYQIMQGDRVADDPKTRDFVNKLMKIACVYMGRTRKWLEEMRDGDTKNCPWCTKSIPVQAIVCPECQRVVDFEGFAKLEARQKAAMQAGAAAPEPESELIANPQ